MYSGPLSLSEHLIGCTGIISRSYPKSHDTLIRQDDTHIPSYFWKEPSDRPPLLGRQTFCQGHEGRFQINLFLLEKSQLMASVNEVTG